MRKFLDKAKSTFDELDTKFSSSSSAPKQHPIVRDDQPCTISSPTAVDLLRYRYHHGTNVGSIFVLEKWLCGSMFCDSASGDSELDAVTASVKEVGLEATKQKWEDHWANAVKEDEWQWLANDAKCTTIRLPIGYFTLGAQWCHNSPFGSVGEVYGSAWNAVKGFIQKARSYGIGVLVDFHGVYGGANSEAHSGTSSGKADLWGNNSSLHRSKDALVWIAGDLRGIEGVVGIQVCNEAVYNANGMFRWYEDVIGAIASVDQSVPIYVSDAWDLKSTLNWTAKRHIFGGGPSNPIVIDTHRYFTFSDKDRSQSPQEIIARINAECGEMDGRTGGLTDRGEAEIVVGEWSCVLDGQTWGRSDPSQKDSLVKQFGNAQSHQWQQKAGGSYFWTYKMDWMDGGEWGFAEQTKKGNIYPPGHFRMPAQEVRSRSQNADGQRQEMAQQARQAHEGYWNSQSPGKQFDHNLYGQGWDAGFTDAQRFFLMRSEGALGDKVASEGGDKIGCMEIWTKKRLLESGQRGEFAWEWEQGFRAGVGAFYQAVGI